MITTPAIPTLADAKHLDAVLDEINARLATELTWLDSTFRQAEKRKKKVDNKTISYPGIFTGNKEYLNLLPDSHMGCFSFWHIEDGEEVEYYQFSHNDYKPKFSLIIWFDYDKVFPSPANSDEYTIQNVKDLVMSALTHHYKKSTITSIGRVWYDADNIYQEYDIDEVNDQFLMRPFGGLRIEGTLRYKETC